MKKLILLSLICAFSFCQMSYANEIAEDYIDIATSYAIEGDYAKSLKFINNALSISPNDREIIELKETVSGILNPNFRSILTSANPFFINAKNSARQGNKASEYSILQQNAEKGNFWASYFLAGKYLDDNDFSNALIYYKKAVSIKPNYYQTYLSMALAQNRCMQYSGALQNIETYLKANPHSDTAYALKADTLFKLHRYDEALQNINQALVIADNAEYQLIKGKILYNKGFYLEAMKIFENLSNIFMTSEIYEYLGLCQYKLKNYAESLLNLDKAILLSNDDKNLNMKYNEVKLLLENEQNKTK